MGPAPAGSSRRARRRDVSRRPPRVPPPRCPRVRGKRADVDGRHRVSWVRILLVLLAVGSMPPPAASAGTRAATLLVVTVTKGFRHESIPTAERVLRGWPTERHVPRRLRPHGGRPDRQDDSHGARGVPRRRVRQHDWGPSAAGPRAVPRRGSRRVTASSGCTPPPTRSTATPATWTCSAGNSVVTARRRRWCSG